MLRYNTARAEDFCRRLLNGLTLQAIGNVEGLTRERVRQIIERHAPGLIKRTESTRYDLRAMANCRQCGKPFRRYNARTHCSMKCSAVTVAEMNRKYADPVDAFFDKVIIPDDPDACWGWAGYTVKGYAGFSVGSNKKNRYYRAHVFSWIYHNREDSAGYDIHHDCRNPICSNPRHLIRLTRREHILIDGRSSKGRKKRTHCKRGHELTPDNLYYFKDGGRYCKTCKLAYVKQRRAKS